MRQVPLIISIIALLGVIVLFINKPNENPALNEKDSIKNSADSISIDNTTKVSIAYIDAQRITNEYEYYKEITTELEEKQKRAEAEFTRKAESFQKEVEDYQKKAQMGAFLSAQSQQAQETSLRQKQENLAVLEQDLSMKLQSDLQKLDTQAHDTIMKYLKGFNENAKYDLILNSATILDAGKTVDVTDTILSILNTQYQNQQTKK